MANWKEEAIAEYAALELRKSVVIQVRVDDEELKNAKHAMEAAAAMYSALEQPYNDNIEEINLSIVAVRDILKEKWDTEDKTYECNAGSATIRTTKSLEIRDKTQLIQTLVNLDKLQDCVRSWNLSYLRKLKDVALISDEIAYYEEHQNVVVKGAK